MKKVITTGIVLSLLMISAIIASAASDNSQFHKETVAEATLNISNVVYQQPQVKTFNTELGTIKATNFGGKIGDLPDPVKLNQEIKATASKQLPATGPLGGIYGGIYISGTLPPYSADEWGTVYLLDSEMVTVSLSWYPSGSEMIVGLKNVDTGVISWGPGMTGGSGTWYLPAWQPGNYNIVILNHSGQTVTYNGYTSW